MFDVPAAVAAAGPTDVLSVLEYTMDRSISGRTRRFQVWIATPRSTARFAPTPPVTADRKLANATSTRCNRDVPLLVHVPGQSSSERARRHVRGLDAIRPAGDGNGPAERRGT